MFSDGKHIYKTFQISLFFSKNLVTVCIQKPGGDVFWDPGGCVFGYTLSLGWVILFCFLKKILRFGMFYLYFCHQKTSLITYLIIIFSETVPLILAKTRNQKKRDIGPNFCDTTL